MELAVHQVVETIGDGPDIFEAGNIARLDLVILDPE